ncbi:NPCBM/NEW2 domain-containing protein [Herbidospora mongoliensis]|uniref:NPCBM/NEW2 domain-containing protein n=1 Tax=Herbidospora mongoliensis TaxID=688067 RepID=UPI00082EDB6B|nr:NPCBM/NEW2 domain-containing protein [Herbidospora mongoliensis]
MLRVNLIIGLSTAVITLVGTLVGLRFLPAGGVVAIAPKAEVTVIDTVTALTTVTATATQTVTVTQAPAAPNPAAAGEPVDSQPMAAASGALFLADKDASDDHWAYRDTYTIKRTRYTRAIAIATDNDGGFVEYTLESRYATFKTTLGINDLAGDSCEVAFRFYGDGTLLHEQSVEYAKPKKVEFPIGDAVKIRISADDLSGNCFMNSGGAAVMGDPHLASA